MAQTGYTPIKIYASSTASAVPLAANLDNTNGAELAINIADGKLFYKDSGGTVKVIAGTGGTGVVAGSNTQIQFNNNGVFDASSSLTWDGTKITTTGLSNTGNTTLGDAAADSLTVNATITSNLIFTDNTYDIGASGATRPRSIYLAGNATTGGSVNVGTALLVNTATQYGQASVYSTTTYSPAGGVIVAATNNSSTGQNIASFWNNHASVNTELDFGSAAQFVPSIQARVYSNGATTSLALNPSGGYVGIGTSSPTTIFNTVFSGGAVSGTHSMAFGYPYAANLQLKSTNAGTGVPVASVGLYSNPERGKEFAFYNQANESKSGYLGYVYAGGASLVDLKLYNSLAGALIFGANNSEVGRFTSAGRFGIGKTSPNSLLDAYGCFDAQNAQLTSGSTVDIPINAGIGNAVLFLVLIASNANSNANSAALLLVNTRSWAYGGGNGVALISSTQGSTGTSNEPNSQSYTLSGSGSNVYLRVGASASSGSSFTVYTRMITVV